MHTPALDNAPCIITLGSRLSGTTTSLTTPDDRYSQMGKPTSNYSNKGDGGEQDGKYERHSLLRDGGPTLSVRVPIVVNTDEYEVFPDEFCVTTVLRERQRDGELFYTCKFDDGHVAEVSLV